ncbi:hypothetical protein BK784_01815 [Bacillus thuringiensis serovar medellin]|uniref:Uncharacterized protein n=1 Tax=Bacillus thuringiensis subsp. medellin TaxID=79672 RepID=A0A9X6N8E9_BACTV|nr:hypothetical protein [Bacillus thuringiensis]OUC03754.1 hypothetical protein BK784_01815 [Bacillus thuringiensis serovar medellin]
MVNEAVFLDKVMYFLDDQFLNKDHHSNGSIFDLQVVQYFKERYKNSTGLVKEQNKAVYYFSFEEFLNQMLRPFDTRIKEAMQLKRFQLPDFKELLSLQEFELVLNQKKINIDKSLKVEAITILNSEINNLYKEKWIFLDELSLQTNDASYLNFYKMYYGEMMEYIYLQKNKILKMIKRRINTPSKNNVQPDLKMDLIIKDIENTTKQLGVTCNFNEIQQKQSQNSFSMYYSFREGTVLLTTKEPKNYIDLLKVWHEFGHVVHYQNMDKSLLFPFSKLHNLHNMEGIAIYYQFLGNELYKYPFDFKIYDMLWWTFIEFFTVYEWLESNMKENIEDLFANNLQLVYEKLPTYPCPIRYFNKGFKSFRYILGLFLAFGIRSYLEKRQIESGEYIKEIMYNGGIHRNDELIFNGCQYVLNQ